MIDINPGILLSQIITFLIALIVLWKIAWGPLTQMMKQREEDIRKNIETAKTERVAAENLRKNYETQLSQARIEAQEIINQSIAEGHREREQIIIFAREEAEKLLEATRRELVSEKKRLVKELQSEVTGLAIGIAEKLVKETVDKRVQEKIFKQVVDNLDDEGIVH